MLKFLSGIAIIAFMSICGYFFAAKYRRRMLFFSQFKEFNDRFLNELLYYRRPMHAFINVHVYRKEFQQLLKSFFIYLENGETIEIFYNQLEEYDFLSTEERKMTCDYFLMLGKGDSLSQKNFFSAQKAILEKLQGQTTDTCKKYGNLYVKIGFLFGLLILILIM